MALVTGLLSLLECGFFFSNIALALKAVGQCWHTVFDFFFSCGCPGLLLCFLLNRMTFNIIGGVRAGLSKTPNGKRGSAPNILAASRVAADNFGSELGRIGTLASQALARGHGGCFLLFLWRWVCCLSWEGKLSSVAAGFPGGVGGSGGAGAMVLVRERWFLLLFPKRCGINDTQTLKLVSRFLYGAFWN